MLIAVLVALSATGYFLFLKMLPAGTAGDIVTRAPTRIAFPVLFSPLPAIVILYGRCSGNQARAAPAGVLPLPIVFTTGFFLLRPDTVLLLTIRFIIIPSAVCGLVGYCAARRTKEYLAVSVILTGLWLFFRMNALN